MDATFWIALSVLGMLVAMAIVQGRAKDQLRVVERKIDILLRNAGIDPAAIADRELTELLRAGRKADAIHLHRQLAGSTPTEAKQHVENVDRQL